MKFRSRIAGALALAALACFAACDSKVLEECETLTQGETCNANENGEGGPDGDSEGEFAQTPPAGLELEELEALSSSRVFVDYDGKVPSHVEATFPAEAGDPEDPVSPALLYLERFRNLYRLEEPASQLVPRRVYSDETGDHVFFMQQHNGVVVHGAELAVHLREGMLTSTNGHWLTYVPDLPPPEIDGAMAGVIAQRDAGGYVAGSATLVYFNRSLLGIGDDVTLLAWQVQVTSSCETGACGGWRYFVDAHTGEVLLRLSLERECDKDFDINHANNTDSSTCWNLPWETADDEMYDEDGRWCGVFEGCATTTADGFAAYNFSHQVYDYFAGNYGRCGWDGDDAQLEVMVHVAFSDGPNAKYRSGCDMLAFSNGFVQLDIFAHEYTHAVTRWTANFNNMPQPGALDEHYSDVFASMLDLNWLIGESVAGGFFRDMANPANGPRRDPDHMLPAQCTAGEGFNASADVHDNAGIPNRAAFLMTDGGTHAGVTVRGIGRAKVAKLFYYVLTGRLSPTSNFMDARNATVTLAREWAGRGEHGFTKADVCSVINAYAAVGLGALDIDCDGFDDVEDGDDDGDWVNDGVDNCSRVKNPYQEDNDGDGQGDACDGDDDNDGVPDNIDGCPFTANPTQSDRDEDGVQDACDNCPDYVRFIPGPDFTLVRWADPDQTDTDRDGQGNLCDTDDDNDGVLDADDNCPTVKNPTQWDRDEDGVGFACDDDEQAPFKLKLIPSEWYLLQTDDCPQCGDFFSPKMKQFINVVLPYGATARVVDDRGNVVAKPRDAVQIGNNLEYSFDLRPGASAFYRFPERATKFLQGVEKVGGRHVMQTSSFYVQTMAESDIFESSPPLEVNTGFYGAEQ